MAFTTNKDRPKLNLETQIYREIPITLINRNYATYNAYRFCINSTRQNVWIPKKHFSEDGTLLPGQNIDYVFRKKLHICELAGVWKPIFGIKKATEITEQLIIRYNECKWSNSEPILTEEQRQSFYNI